MRLECCPFCGGEAKLEEAQGGQAVNFDPVYRAQCSQCYRTDFPFRSWKSEAISEWNRRATPPAPAPDGWEVAGFRYRYEPQLQWHLVEFEDQLPRREGFAQLEIQKVYAPAPPAPTEAPDA